MWLDWIGWLGGPIHKKWLKSLYLFIYFKIRSEFLSSSQPADLRLVNSILPANIFLLGPMRTVPDRPISGPWYLKHSQTVKITLKLLEHVWLPKCCFFLNQWNSKLMKKSKTITFIHWWNELFFSSCMNYCETWFSFGNENRNSLSNAGCSLNFILIVCFKRFSLMAKNTCLNLF